MKVLLVNDNALPTAGAEILALTLRDGLRRRGHNARLFTSSARPIEANSPADYECFGTTSSFRTLLQTLNPWAFWRLRHVLAEFRPDVVHVLMFLTQLSPLILPLLKEVPSIFHVQWYRPICPVGTKMLPDGRACQKRAGWVCYRSRCLPARDWLLLMLQMKLWRRWRHSFDLIVANSEAVRQRLTADGIESVEVMWNGVSVRPPRPALAWPPTVAFAGQMARTKGVDVLLSAFVRVVREIPEARLLLAGDGPEREALARLILQLGLSSSTSALGHLPHSELERHFAPAWVQAVPSRWAEPFGLVAAEAMMRGTAVVASNSGGLAEIVRDGRTGFLVPPGDSDRLAEALLRLLRDRELAEKMGRAGREVALSQFSEDCCVEGFLLSYERLLALESNHRSRRSLSHAAW